MLPTASLRSMLPLRPRFLGVHTASSMRARAGILGEGQCSASSPQGCQVPGPAHSPRLVCMPRGRGQGSTAHLRLGLGEEPESSWAMDAF